MEKNSHLSWQSSADEKKDYNKERVCYTCGKLGHLAINCSAKHLLGFGRRTTDDKPGSTKKRWQPTCHICSQLGHVSRECPQSRDYSERKDANEWKSVRFSGPSGNEQTH